MLYPCFVEFEKKIERGFYFIHTDNDINLGGVNQTKSRKHRKDKKSEILEITFMCYIL